MKYLFILVIIWAYFKLFVLKNVQNKKAYIALCAVTVIVGIISLAVDFSVADLIKRWI